jgi:hypothetical protein
MSEIEIKSMPSSWGNNLVAGFIASQMFLNSIPFGGEWPRRAEPLVDYKLSPSTHGTHDDLFSAAQLVHILETRPALATFYAELLAKQERLGREFEQVLFENLWDLYSR